MLITMVSASNSDTIIKERALSALSSFMSNATICPLIVRGSGILPWMRHASIRHPELAKRLLSMVKSAVQKGMLSLGRQREILGICDLLFPNLKNLEDLQELATLASCLSDAEQASILTIKLLDVILHLEQSQIDLKAHKSLFSLIWPLAVRLHVSGVTKFPFDKIAARAVYWELPGTELFMASRYTKSRATHVNV